MARLDWAGRPEGGPPEGRKQAWRGGGRRGLLLGVLLLLPSCGRHPAPAGGGLPATGEVGVQVENQNSANLVIYYYVRGTGYRLGLVTTGRTASFVLPWSRLGSGGTVRFQARVVGGSEGVATDQLRVEPGQMVHWTLMPDLQMSSVSVY